MQFNSAVLISVIFTLGCTSQNGSDPIQSFQGDPDHLLIEAPEHGFVSVNSAAKWEEAMLTGNGTIGAMVMGNPMNERIILSHEKLFMPENPPTEAPKLGENLDKIRAMVLAGQGEEANEFAMEVGEESGIHGMIWTDPLIPACQLEIVPLEQGDILNYSRSVNYETGEASAAWETDAGTYLRKIFTSRPDKLLALKISSLDNKPVNTMIRLASLPINEGESDDDDEDFSTEEVIEDVFSTVEEDGRLKYITRFRKKWEGSLKGYVAESIVSAPGASMTEKNGWLHIRDAEEIQVLSSINLSYELPIEVETGIDKYRAHSYEDLLKVHSGVQGEMFNRFSLDLGEQNRPQISPQELLKSSSFGNLNPELVEQLCDAARYIFISSTGKIPPTLQGIWGGTWRPAWSGDFTLNGNVPSAIASGLNTNFQELTEAYMNYMFNFFDDFRDNARDMYDAPGIFVPSRASSSGKTYHYGDYHPHQFWYAGGAWTSHFFYDYWQFTGNETFLRERAIPFMQASMEFYEHILTRDMSGKYMFLPSYSPEVGPMGQHPLAINATMDIAALKQLIRRLLSLSEAGYIDRRKVSLWQGILENLPAYAIDESGDLKEWIWPGLENDNQHRHASHLYPLFDEVAPDFQESPELVEAAKTAIEKRLEYRREKEGAEMAFGLVQLGLAAAHLKDTEHAYECVDWLCNSYWSPAFTSYHDPGEIFNVDICGGLPAVVTEMIIQSGPDEVELLPALPDQWPDGEIRGVGTRCGVTLDLEWRAGKPVSATFAAGRNTSFRLIYGEDDWKINLEKGEQYLWEMKPL